MSAHLDFDVLISGAGPAGSTFALALASSGLKVALIDKHSFPRDKVCGDAIGGRVKSVLRKINPQYEVQLEQFDHKLISRGWKLFAPNHRSAELLFTTPGYISKRIHFDNWLYNLATHSSNIFSFTGNAIADVSINDDGVRATLDNGKTIKAEVIAGCDGAHSIVRKKTIGGRVDASNYSGAVRAYYENISDVKEGMIEIHLIKDFLPGYFWIFPLPDNICNIGFGMLSKDISRRKINLRKSMQRIISESPGLKDRFRGARACSETEGFGLPLGGNANVFSGNRFLLCGDAASLIDPLNGEGIGNAMLSAYLGAREVINAFQKNDFSAEQLNSYNLAIQKDLLSELKKKLFYQKLFNRKWLINFLVTAGSSNKFLRAYIGKRL